jgi:hypothetical protein
MSNVTEFPNNKKANENDTSYNELLEENRGLRKELEALRAKTNGWDKSAEKYDRLKNRLLRKKQNMRRRARTMAEVDTIKAYEHLRDPNKFPELFGTLKATRWPLHAATTAYNLSVTKRRHIKGVSESFTAFANANPRHLTLLRLCMNKYSKMEEITTGDIVHLAEKDFNIPRRAVNKFFEDCTREGVLIKDSHGHYEISERTIDDYFYNLLTMIFSKETVRLVTLLNKIYGMVDLELVKIYGAGYGGHRMAPQSDIRRAKFTAYEQLLRELDDEN